MLMWNEVPPLLGQILCGVLAGVVLWWMLSRGRELPGSRQEPSPPLPLAQYPPRLVLLTSEAQEEAGAAPPALRLVS